MKSILIVIMWILVFGALYLGAMGYKTKFKYESNDSGNKITIETYKAKE